MYILIVQTLGCVSQSKLKTQIKKFEAKFKNTYTL